MRRALLAALAEENGRALRYQMPLLGPVAPEQGT